MPDEHKDAVPSNSPQEPAQPPASGPSVSLQAAELTEPASRVGVWLVVALVVLIGIAGGIMWALARPAASAPTDGQGTPSGPAHVPTN